MRKKWTLETIKKEALKYKTRKEFQSNSPAWQAAYKRKILDQVCSHMTSNYENWNTETIQEEALKYQFRNVFAAKSPRAYRAAQRRGILEKICRHMDRHYTEWTIEKVQSEALKYKTRVEFKNNSECAYQAALRFKIINKVCSHMEYSLLDWSLCDIKSEALRYTNRLVFSQKSSKAYHAARRKNVLDQVCSHMLPATNTSTSENDLFNKIKELFPKAQKLVDRKVNIPNKSHIRGFDIDIYIPELRRGIEFDGIYYHSFSGLKRGRPNWPKEDLENYHKIKDEYFKSKGIELLHINEKDWIKNPEEEIKKCMKFLNKENL